MQQAVQEKFRQANENLDELNKWLEKVERQIASQEIPIEDIDGLKNQINALKVKIIENLVCRIHLLAIFLTDSNLTMK